MVENSELERNTEKSDRETSNDVLPKGTKPEPKKVNPKDDKISIGEKIKELVKQKFDESFEVKEKNDRIKLNKQIQSELKIAKGWSTDINKAILEIMVERKMKIDDLGFKNDKVGEMKINLISSTGSTSQESTVVTTQTPPKTPVLPYDPSKKGALPKDTTQQQTQTTTERQIELEPEKKFMTASAQKKLISSGLTKIILPIYKTIGICELDEKELKEEAKVSSASKMEKDFEDLAGDIDEYLVENNIKLPAFLNHVAILVTIFVVLVLPVIKFKMFSEKTETKVDYDTDAEKIKVE